MVKVLLFIGGVAILLVSSRQVFLMGTGRSQLNAGAAGTARREDRGPGAFSARRLQRPPPPPARALRARRSKLLLGRLGGRR
jgi:hypothetical protein